MATWKSFLTRAASAVVALTLIVCSYLYFDVNGLKAVVALAIVVAIMELTSILFKDESSVFLKASFYVLSLTTFAASCFSITAGAVLFPLCFITLCILSLLGLHRTGNLNRIFLFQSKVALGLIYGGLLPSFSYQLLTKAQGLNWFIYLLAVVFAGDTMAYVFGVLMGKHKVMPSVSPKKTWQGSVGGIFGSVIAGYICWNYQLGTYPLSFILGLSAVSGFVGQFGDFFESLLKRIANIKDSGKIMPGHGGILDRIDGVLFAGPVIFCGVVILSHLSS